ncbi:PssD/Cps14F family polysaccharide biosynthesis glycosyltransferase [Coprobacter sp.]|uniref:PssD/Cps14F family polysaccharide biosynthesis glycosyltransferase n=1 Tax=Coprobacter sp. TaxID=1941478 RepID=UPI003AB8C465
MQKKKNQTKICLISSHGGHLHELTRSIQNVRGYMYWVTFRTKHTEALLKDKPHYFVIDPVTSKLKFLLNTFQSLYHLLRERPKVIISTGAGIAIPTMMLGKYLFGAKIIYVESAAAVIEPSRTGQFIYKHADLFLIQWESLKSFYPNAKYIGVL